MRYSFSALFMLASLIGICGCSLFSSGIDETGDIVRDRNIGQACEEDEDCREGLVCTDEVCEPAGSLGEDDPCEATAECAEGLYCSNTRVCAPAGDSALGESCTGTADCEKGLICAFNGVLALVCSETGDRSVGESCERTIQCAAGLTCASVPSLGEGDAGEESAAMECFGGAQSPLDLVAPVWDGVSCEEDDGPATAYFEVPRTREPVAEFYRLPFPNDIRRTAGGLDLSGHAAPDVANLPLIDTYLRTAEQDLDGFATNPVIIFRFSRPLRFSTVNESSVHVVDITPDSPTYDREHARRWRWNSGKTRYICNNSLSVAVNENKPLRPNTTYAVYLTTDVLPEKQEDVTFARPSDLVALLEDGTPSDAALQYPHTVYAPFRAWLQDSGTDSYSILNAAVFTTQDPEALLPELRAAVHDAAMPAVSQLVACGAGNDPCPRDCANEPGYQELHGLISLPIFQQGTPPYEEKGGDIVLDSNGTPQIARSEQVCFALAVPDEEPPPEGFPLVIFGHGTGGSFGNLISNGIARDLATGSVDGTAVHAAAMGIDMPQHGDRRGGSDGSPEELFFNFINPRAARDNVLQGAADLMSLVRWARTYDLPAGDSPSGRTIVFNENRIALFGHSQGAMHAALMLPYEPDLAAAVLSGNGGYLTKSLLTKTKPFDIAAALPYALLDANSDRKLDSGDYHPVLAILQMFFERADAINYAYRLHSEPPAGASSGHHIFMTYGLEDNYSTEETQKAYAKAADLTVVGDDLVGLGLTRADAPLSENVELDGVARTVGLRQYRPSAGEDGHFVAFDQAKGRPDVLRFLLQALSGQSPEIGQ